MTLDLEQLAKLPDLVKALEARISVLEARPVTLTQAQLLTVAEAATALGMSEGAVRAAISRNTIPSVRVGRRVRVPSSAIPRS